MLRLAAVLAVAGWLLIASAHAATQTQPTLTFTVQHGAKTFVCNRWVYSAGWLDRCVRVAAVRTTASARTRLDFGVTWAHWWNRQAAAHKNPLRVVQIGCKTAAVGIYVCDFSVQYNGVVRCERAVILSSGQVGSAKREKCGPAPALWWSAPEGISRKHRA